VRALLAAGVLAVLVAAPARGQDVPPPDALDVRLQNVVDELTRGW